MALTDIATYLPPYASGNRVPVQNAPVITSPVAFTPKRSIGRVNGQEGAQSYPMGPDSSELVLDENQSVVWLIITDQNGTKTTAKGFRIGEEYQPPKPVTMEDLMTEIKSINNRLQKVEEGYTYGQSNHQPSAQVRTDSAGSAVRQPGKVDGSGGADRKPPGSSQPAE